MHGPHQYPGSICRGGTTREAAETSPEIIPKFINLLRRDRCLIILDKSSVGQVYNVGSHDKITNIELAKESLSMFGKDLSGDLRHLIEYTRDRPLNDRRYAVDASKLRGLDWKPKASFEHGLRATVEWYREFGAWWDDIQSVLTPFPVVPGDAIAHESAIVQNGRKPGASETKIRDFAVQRKNHVDKCEEIGDLKDKTKFEEEATLGANESSEKLDTNGFDSLKTDSMYKVIEKRKVEQMGQY